MPPAKKPRTLGRNVNAFERDTQETEEDWGSDDDGAGDDKSDDVLFEDAPEDAPPDTTASRQLAKKPKASTPIPTRQTSDTTIVVGSSGKGKKRGKEPLVRRTYSDLTSGFSLT